MAEKQHKRTREIWKVVPGYPGYEVSNLGRARSLDRIVPYRKRTKQGAKGHYTAGQYTDGRKGSFRKGKLLRAGSGTKTSPYVTVYLGKERHVRVHAAVLLAFVGPRPNGLVCCHNNGNKLDNRLDNLRYDTIRNNILDRALHGTDNSGERHGMSKLSDADTRFIMNASIELERRLAKRFNVTESCIRGIIAKRRRRRRFLS